LGLIPMVMMGALRQPSITPGSGNAGGRVIALIQTKELDFPSGPFSGGVLDVKS
jgi:hypothetical protein